MSTVGYGDLAPTSTLSRLVSVPYLLIGVVFVFTLAGIVVDDTMSTLQKGCNSMLINGWRGFKQAVKAAREFQFSAPRVQPNASARRMLQRTRRKSLSGSMPYTLRRSSTTPNWNGEAKLMSAWQFYGRSLAFYLLSGVLISQVASAWVLSHLQPDLNYATALWHCFITASTIGFGDVDTSEQGTRAFCALHVLFSVSWLAGLVRRISACIKWRKIQIQMVEMTKVGRGAARCDDTVHIPCSRKMQKRTRTRTSTSSTSTSQVAHRTAARRRRCNSTRN